MRLRTFAAVISVAGLMVGSLSPLSARSGSSAEMGQVKNAVKGQGQVSGLYAQFGTTYTLKNNFNFTLLKALYTLEPFNCYSEMVVGTEQKMLVLDIAVKNVAKDDNALNSEGFMTLVDEKGQLYNIGSGALALKSLGKKFPDMNLKPGQGLGQPNLKDPLQIGFTIPGIARIVKIIVNVGRLGKSEEVMRYNIAGATKEEAGAPGDPLNVIAPLPENVRDPADKSGAVALADGSGKKGEYVPSGYFDIRLDGVAVATDKLNNEDAPDGKKYVVATVTAKFVMDDGNAANMFTIEGGDFPLYAIKDSDGERYKPTGYRKPKSDEEPDHKFETGDEYAFRIFFVVPKDATLKTLTLGTGSSRKWDYDVSDVK